jgi:phthalate 4,5-cis-dihydrodiol dehydrogenase
MRTLKMGVAGVGQGAAAVIPTIADLPEFELVAAADKNPRMRAGFLESYPGTRVYESVADLCKDPAIDAIWVSTPNKFHCEHAIEAMRNGKHVAVEKPMAVTLEEADRMVEASEKYGVHLVAAHTSSYGIPVRAMRKLAQTPEIGSVRSILIWSYTDWMLRPRTAEELSPEAGSGIVHRQGPHQIDVLRLLGGGKVRSVRGTTGAWMPERAIPGFFTAFFEFENGTSATILLNGYGYFMTASLFEGALDGWRYTEEDRVRLRKELRGHARDEDSEKEEFRIGGPRDPGRGDTTPRPWAPVDLGMLVVSCDRADLRHSAHGVYVHGDECIRDIDLRPLVRKEVDLEGGATVGALGELYAAATGSAPVYHSAAWGRATLEATIALVESAKEHREITLERQVAMPDAYDAAMSIDGTRETSTAGD